MSSSKASYKQILKATSLFGGVQIIKIIIQIVQQKIIAILLGPAGMGISGLYTSAISLIQGITSMGLTYSAVKNVAEANGTNDFEKISKTITVFRKLVWITGLLGMSSVIILSPYLSKTTFGNYDYTLPFVFLSVSLLFQQLSQGQSAILQGMRKLKYLAKSNVLGSLLGLLISIPIYFFFGIRGIVPTLILNTLTSLTLSYYFSRKIKISNLNVSVSEIFQEGKEMLQMGIVMSLNSLFTVGVAYLIRIFIVRIGGTEEVGLYTAAYAIINTYAGMVFTAMGTDFYPRLASVNIDNKLCNKMVNQQAEIAVLILTPFLLFFLLVAPKAITILYSNRFIPIEGFLEWASLGMLFKATSWTIGFLYLAKQDMKVFIINEVVANIILLTCNLLGYYYYGLDGLGIAFTFSYCIYLGIVFFIARRRYSFSLNSSFLKLKIVQLTFLICTFVLVYRNKGFYTSLLVFLLLIICSIYSLYQLNKRIGIIQILKNKLNGRKNK